MYQDRIRSTAMSRKMPKVTEIQVWKRIEGGCAVIHSFPRGMLEKCAKMNLSLYLSLPCERIALQSRCYHGKLFRSLTFELCKTPSTVVNRLHQGTRPIGGRLKPNYLSSWGSTWQVSERLDNPRVDTCSDVEFPLCFLLPFILPIHLGVVAFEQMEIVLIRTGFVACTNDRC